ncbi:hypothetical protein DTL21_11275 [Bremerella cremea]|uniref:Uncharacterized protein n=1 Tax=Blastopirellula marina TaxID=124 RepID=A0A2S8FPL6_9BACT|nr:MULTISPECIES: hypothetical protein [Pirellulaceae]PQO34116.1 hypothetical protein C5Y83_11270 [Blastopirellula marina]RCS46613.1 hypothetical protein DTL21_11275 [Bremerella cremea]
MKTLVTASLLILVLVVTGCKNQQAQQLNPFNAYGMQRVPPPGTQSYGQSAVTAPNPYYQAPAGAPAASQAPTLNGGYQQSPPAQFSPPSTSAPANMQPPSSYGQGQWQKVSGTTSSSGVSQASYTEEVATQSSSAQAATSSATSSASTDAMGPGTSSGTTSNPYTNGMRVNDLTEVAQPLSPPATSTVPYGGWTTPPAASASTQSVPQPSRIP